MFKVGARFIGDFKDGDNIKYNLEILNVLYTYYNQAVLTREKLLLCKPIIILLVSVIEAVVDDLFFKIDRYHREGVSNIPIEMMEKIRSKKYKKLDNQLDLCIKYDIFDGVLSNFYATLKELIKLRNRIHIQNNKMYIPLDEDDAFSESKKVSAEKICEYIFKKMVNKFDRGPSFNDYIGYFEMPWEEHFSNSKNKL
ncbi:MAG: hypothetical protein WCP18_03480 [bacterium]